VMGVAITLGGISTMLAGQPKTPKQSKPSYLLSGPSNLIEEGEPVPLIFGRCYVGGNRVLAESTVEKI
jgi:predicted phage tail protein